MIKFAVDVKIERLLLFQKKKSAVDFESNPPAPPLFPHVPHSTHQGNQAGMSSSVSTGVFFGFPGSVNDNRLALPITKEELYEEQKPHVEKLQGSGPVTF